MNNGGSREDAHIWYIGVGVASSTYTQSSTFSYKLAEHITERAFRNARCIERAVWRALLNAVDRLSVTLNLCMLIPIRWYPYLGKCSLC